MVVVEDLLEGEARVLRAGVAVVDELDVGAVLAARQGHPQRIEDEAGAHVRRKLPAADPPAEHVDDEAEEHHPLMAAHVGEVGDPQRVGPIGGEVAVDEIGAARRRGIGDRRAPRLAAPLGALDGVRVHQALDVVAADGLAAALERQPHLPIAVGVVVQRVQLADAAQEPLVVDHAIGALAGGAVVISGRRHVQDPADRLDAKRPRCSSM